MTTHDVFLHQQEAEMDSNYNEWLDSLSVPSNPHKIESLYIIGSSGPTLVRRNKLAPKKRIHLLTPITASSLRTRCGFPLTSKGEIVWTEYGVEAATCRSCIRLYDSQED